MPQQTSSPTFARDGVQQPDGTTILITNMDGGDTWISLPYSGQLWVAYEYQDQPASSVYIWHQGGDTTPVPPGFNSFTVGATDALVYTLAYQDQSIKLGWAYLSMQQAGAAR